MTKQAADRLMVEGVEYPLFPRSPLEGYLVNRFGPAGRVKMFPARHTGNQRGYIATWELVGETLFLVGPSAILELLFPGHPSKIAASWFSGSLYIPKGEREPIGEGLDLPEHDKYRHYLVMDFANGRLTQSSLVHEV